MSKKHDKKVRSKLRFPEFQRAGDWEEVYLSEVLKEHGSKSIGVEEVYSVSVHKGIINQIEHLGRSFSAGSTGHYKRVLPGDIVYTKSPTGDFPHGIIKQSKISKPVIVSPLYGVFTPLTIALGYILDAYFESPTNTNNYLSSIVQKGAKNTINISNQIFLSKKLYLPTSKAEQQKIAATLSSLDDLITAQSEKIKSLQAHKKSLMQQLFPAEGERVPRLRFPEFWGAGDWEEKLLKEIFSIFQGYAFSSIDSVKKGIRWLKIADVSIQQMNTDTPSYLPYDFKKKYKNFLVHKGDYVIALTRPILGSKIKIAPVDEIFHEALLNQRVGKIESSQEIEFVYYLLQNDKLILEIQNNIAGNDPPNLSIKQIENIQIFIPYKPEQQKIASCLSSLDDLIKTQNQKLEALKKHKKGLMQQLFPNPNEAN